MTGMTAPAAAGLTASAVVRSKDKAATIEATLLALRRQTVPVEIVVVDSGSTDGTAEIAARLADRLISIRAEDFSYGGALNTGARAAHGDVCFALSAHGTELPATWVEDSLRHYADPRVAATNGLERHPDGTAARAPYQPTLTEALSDPTWGYSNHAGSFRRSTWQEHPFREDLRSCEDKEWFWRVLARGWRVTFDPALTIPSHHRRQAGLKALWRRTFLEYEALAALGQRPAGGFRDCFVRWWTDFPFESRWPTPLRRASPYRTVEHWAAYAGTRAGQRHPSPAALPAAVDTQSDTPETDGDRHVGLRP